MGTSIWTLLKTTIANYIKDDTFRFAAALSFYSMLSLAPLLVLLLASAGYFFGANAIQGELVTQLEAHIGREAAEVVQNVIKNASRPGAGLWATIFGFVTLFLGSTGVLVQLQSALNQIWDIRSKPRRAVWSFVRDRLLSFLVLAGVGVLLLAFLVVDALVAGTYEWLAGQLGDLLIVAQALDVVVSVALTTLFFALIFKVLPDADIEWRDIWIGSLVTALLFLLGEQGISLYLGRTTTASAFGAAGSLVVLLLWIYYSSLVVFLGAEFTQVYAELYGSEIKPREHAERAARKPHLPPSWKLGAAHGSR